MFSYKVKKELNVLFSIYIYIYILKKEHNILRSFAKERNVFTFFYVLCKRTLRSWRSWRSFTFIAKECCVLSVLLGFISRQNLKKRTEKNVAFFKRTERSERKRTQCPTLLIFRNLDDMTVLQYS